MCVRASRPARVCFSTRMHRDTRANTCGSVVNFLQAHWLSLIHKVQIEMAPKFAWNQQASRKGWTAIEITLLVFHSNFFIQVFLNTLDRSMHESCKFDSNTQNSDLHDCNFQSVQVKITQGNNSNYMYFLKEKNERVSIHHSDRVSKNDLRRLLISNWFNRAKLPAPARSRDRCSSYVSITFHFVPLIHITETEIVSISKTTIIKRYQNCSNARANVKFIYRAAGRLRATNMTNSWYRVVAMSTFANTSGRFGGWAKTVQDFRRILLSVNDCPVQFVKGG